MNKMVLGVAALAVAGVAGWWIASAPSEMAGLPTPQLGAANAQTSETATDVEILEMALGAEDAPITVVEYGSFTCPHCANFHKNAFGQLKANYIDTGKVRFINREVYFDRFGLWAAMVARCSGPEKYFGIVDIIYTEQREWASGEPGEIVENLRKIGLRAGMEADQIEACLQDGDKAQALVAEFQKNSEADGVRSTPTFIVNGETYSNMSYTDFAAVLDEKLGE